MFEELKHRVVSAPMLEIYDGSTDTWVEVHTDTSIKVLDAILLQKCTAPKHFHPVVYYNKKFNNM